MILMKILTRRAFVVLILSMLLLTGLLIFSFRYLSTASVWVQHPANKHLYQDGQLITSVKILDRNGKILLQTVDNKRKYNESKSVRIALMHATGDNNGNVATGAQVAFRDRLSGWNLVNGTFHLRQSNQSKNDLTLTLDADLCKMAYQALNGRKGTVGIYNYKTGEMLCMVSSPSFDPENPPNVGANPERYEGVYLNRLLSATYTPGSVFKLVTAAAAIDQLDDFETKTYHCGGKTLINGEKVTCPSPHGDVTLEQALAQSCNVAFAEISLELGGHTLQKYAEKAGFNASLKVDQIETAEGKINTENATGGDLAWAGIGQYSDTANPAVFMAYMGAIANDGVRVTPHLVKEHGVKAFLATYGIEKKRILSSKTADRLGKMMRNDVLEVYGERQFEGLELCAKSGTAQVGEDQKPHAWFAGFLDREDYPLAFVVVVENGGSGSRTAGAVAGKVLKAAVASNGKTN